MLSLMSLLITLTIFLSWPWIKAHVSIWSTEKQHRKYSFNFTVSYYFSYYVLLAILLFYWWIIFFHIRSMLENLSFLINTWGSSDKNISIDKKENLGGTIQWYFSSCPLHVVPRNKAKSNNETPWTAISRSSWRKTVNAFTLLRCTTTYKMHYGL